MCRQAAKPPVPSAPSRSGQQVEAIFAQALRSMIAQRHNSCDRILLEAINSYTNFRHPTPIVEIRRSVDHASNLFKDLPAPKKLRANRHSCKRTLACTTHHPSLLQSRRHSRTNDPVLPITVSIEGGTLRFSGPGKLAIHRQSDCKPGSVATDCSH